MHVTINVDQEAAPDIETAARATLELLARITVGGTLVMEVEDGEDTTIVEISSHSYRVLNP